MKLALGTVQFGMSYGINNQDGSPDDENIYNINISSLALNFVKQNKNIDKIVIGADTTEQIVENVKSMNYNLTEDIIKLVYKINVVEKKLLNPVNWN
tara:strand:- start:82 stop:372 length:291 start_codon:yes stop_codon:yes gene_type:complete